MHQLLADHLSLTYDEEPIVRDLNLTIHDRAITTIIGPSGCGKSTLLRGLARLMRPNHGAVLLDGQAIHQLPTREVARRLGLLHQETTPPTNVTVEELAWRGRYPHQSFLQPPTKRDADAVARALSLTGMVDLGDRPIDQLSGGQRQRAWIAMALAQETPILLLDEPTTFLDVAHQLEVFELVQRLNADEGRTIVMVLHDVNDAARVSHRLVAMRDGAIVQVGTPAEILRPDVLQAVYDIECDVYAHPANGQRYCVPRSASMTSAAERISVDSHHQIAPPSLEVASLTSSYGRVSIINDLSLSFPAGAITAIIGPNGCGKSTLLRSCARLLKPTAGTAWIGNRDVWHGSHRQLAQRLALLAQGSAPPAGLSVEELVAIGRRPHQRFLHRWSERDAVVVESALARCHLTKFRDREVEALSGGQRQRAWMGMALAQDTPVLLLDEPTTYLDIAAQIALLDLVRELNQVEGRTVVMVLHDLNLAARYADHLVAMRDGQVIASGPPSAIITEGLLRDVFAIEASITADPISGGPWVLPHGTIGGCAATTEDDLDTLLQGVLAASSLEGSVSNAQV